MLSFKSFSAEQMVKRPLCETCCRKLRANSKNRKTPSSDTHNVQKMFGETLAFFPFQTDIYLAYVGMVLTLEKHYAVFESKRIYHVLM